MTAPIDSTQHFASDNYAGICSEALAALVQASTSGHEPAYGDATNRGRARCAIASPICSRPTARCSSSSTARRRIRWRWPRCASRIIQSFATNSRISKPTNAAAQNSSRAARSCSPQKAKTAS